MTKFPKLLCPVAECPHGRHEGHLMCSRHWKRVPRKIAARVWSSFDALRNCAAAGELAKRRAEYQEAASAAIGAVEAKERTL